MAAIFADTTFGQLVRLLSGGRHLRYSDEIHPPQYEQYVIKERSSSDVEYSNTETPSRTGRSTEKYLLSWDGLEDPDNPRNWPIWKKVWVTFQICLLTTSVYIGSSIYATGTEDIMRVFGVSRVAATLGLCLFVAGYGVGPMIWSSMSEVPLIGRNPIYIGTLAIFVALQIPTAKSSSFGMLLAMRFVTGFFGSPVLATGGATMADIWTPAKRAYAISLWGVAAVMGPSTGPLVGGFAVQYGPIMGEFNAPWTWPIWELTWLSALCLVALFFFLPETSANNILVRRTQRLRKALGVSKEQLTCQPEVMQDGMTVHEIVSMVLIRPLTLNFTEPMVLAMNLYIALIYGLLYIWFESFPIVFGEIYGFNLSQTGLAYLGILVGLILVTCAYFIYLYYWLEPQFDENGEICPEARLTAGFVGCWCIPICLFWFGWSARANVHWIMPIVGSAWFPVGMFLLFNSILNYLPDAYPEYVASVLAGNDLMRSAFGAGFPLFATAMYRNLGIGWASSTLAFISVAFIPIPFVLHRYGGTLRRNYSRHARKDI